MIVRPVSALGAELLAALGVESGDQLVERVADRVAEKVNASRADELLDPAAAAKLTGRNVDALVRAARRGRVAGAVRVGGRWRFRRGDLVGGR